MATGQKITETQDERYEPQKLLITPGRIGVFLYILVSIAVGIVALLVKPVMVVGVVVAALFGVLILLYPYFGLLVYYMSLVVNPAMLFPSLAALRPDAVLAGFLLFSLIIHKKLKGERFIFQQQRMSWHMLALAGAMTLSVPMSVWPTFSFWTVVDFLKVVAYYLLIINIVTNENRLKGFIWIFIVCAGYDAISSAIAYFRGSLMFAQGIERAESLAGADPNTLAVNLDMAIPFMAFAIIWTKNNFLKLVAIGLVLASIFTVSITGSRSGMIGLVLVLFFIWFMSPKRIVTASILLVAMSFGWFVLPAQYQERYGSIFHKDVDESTQGRFEAWKAGFNMFMARPLTGIGVGNFAVAYASGDYSRRGVWLKAHSLYVQLIAELGLAGVVTFVPLIWYMMRQNFRLRKRMLKEKKDSKLIKWISYSITITTFTLFFTSIFGHSLFRIHWYWCSGLTVVLWALADKIQSTEKEVDGKLATGIPRAVSR